MTEKKYVLAIDQGTTSSRAILFDHGGQIVATGQKEHEQIFPRAGWVEHDPNEVWENVREVVGIALGKGQINRHEIAAVGITNQRETTVVWDRTTGEPVYNAIVWQDTRTDKIVTELGGDEGQNKYKARTGLPLATYFCGPKVKWILDNVEGTRERAEAGDLVMGTMDTWLLWNITGGARGDQGRPAVHATDVTNASRTLLMDIRSLKWDEELCDAVGVPPAMLPEIRPSVGDFGTVRARGSLGGVPLTAILGDQQSAMVGQGCLGPGEAKTTYGTGLFLLQNTGERPEFSEHGLLTTVAYQVDGQAPHYALEGSVAVGGSLVQWLRDQLGMIRTAPQVEELARGCEDNGGVYVVPAFSGLFAPRWRADARGVIVGLTRFADRHHIARAVLEATAYQVREVIDAMAADGGRSLDELRVDGGMTDNDLLMQFQADLLGVDVVRPRSTETTAAGACFAAGLGAGLWSDTDEIRKLAGEGRRWSPAADWERMESLYRDWNRAVERSCGWVAD